MDDAIKRGRSLHFIPQKNFCSFIVSNGKGMPERLTFFNLLSQYKHIDSGGAFMNNIGKRVDDKLMFEHAHKFCITFENESYPGYSTEKIVDAFAAGSIPIYYGDPYIGEEFNTKAFINCHDYKNFEEVVERIKEVDQNEELYEQMLNEPVLKRPLPGLVELEVFLCRIIDQNISEAYRRPKSMHAKNIHYHRKFDMTKIKRKLKKLLI